MGKAPAVQTADAFFEILQKSRLLSEEQLAEVKEETSGMDDPRAVARLLLKKNLLTRWQASQLLAGFHALIIGKYKLCDAIGRGELGRVFLAQHGQLGRRVALKTLSRQHTQQSRVLERFLTEARKIADLDHRNVIHVYDIDDEDGRYFLVTEYAEGSDLQKLVDEKGALPFSEAAELIRQAAEGLAFLHERGLTHQDLKPANIVLNTEGTVKLLDVGVGSLREAVLGDTVGSSAETATGPRYLSPEQLGGHPSDERSDLFSLGCILYWLLTGAPPYPRATSAFGSVQPLAELRPDAPEELVELCESLMALQPAERTIAARDVRDRLTAFCDTQAEASPEPKTRASDTQTMDADTKTLDAGVFGGLPGGDDEPVGDFAISTKKRRGVKNGKKKKASKTEPVAAPASEPAAEVSKKSSSNAKLWIILGAGAGAVVVVIGLIAFMFMRGDSAVAKADEQKQESNVDADAGGTGPDDNVGDPEIGDPEIGDPEISDPEISDPEIGDPAVDPSAAVGENVEDAGTNPAAIADAGTAEAGTAAPGAGTGPANGAANDNATQPVSAAGDANKTAGGADTPKPMNDGKPTPDKAEPPKKATPAPPKPDKTQVATNTKDPLGGIPKVTELPLLFGEDGSPHPDAFKPKALGTIVLADKVLCSIYMRGGDGAARGRKVFGIRNANGGLSEREWEIRLDGSEIGGENLVATLKIADDNKLYFQWTEDAPKDPISAHLINCILNVNLTVGGATKDLALRRPVSVDPITVDMDRQGSKVRWELPTPPNPDKVFITVAGLPAPFPKSVLDPEKPVPAERSTQLVRVGEKPEDQVLVLKIDTTMKRNIEVSVTAWAQFNKAVKMERINKASLKKMAITVDTGAKAASFKVAQLAAAKVPGNDKGKKQQLEQLKNLANQDMARWTALNSKMEKLKVLYEKLNGQGNIKFRMYYQTEAGEVTLLRTK